MLKKLLFIFAIISTTALHAQVYLGFGAGYGFGAGRRVNGYEIKGTEATNIYGSYGKGFLPEIKVGMMINEHFGLEMGFSYLIGAKQTKLNCDTAFIDSQANGLRFIPQLVYRFDNGFYGRFGLILPLLGKNIERATIEMSPSMKVEKELENKGSFSVGFAGALGYQFQLNDKFKLYLEAQYVGLAIRSGFAEYTKYEVNGVDQLENMSVGQKKFEFYDKVDNAKDNTRDNPNWDPTEPTVMLRQNAPFSAIEFKVGITFDL